MKSYRFKALLRNDGWTENATVSVDETGAVAEITDAEIADSVPVNGYALPAFQNAHSHAFQYAMAGLAENHDGAKNETDDFWSWRETMYQLALNINPEQLKIIARMVYAEMLRNGCASVAEFHYIHHDVDGRAYSNLAETSEALLEAASEAGIRITLVPIFYQRGNFGQNPNERQRRFISATFDEYLKLHEAAARACKNYPNANVAVGVHSLRGVEAADVLRTVEEAALADLPFHIHVAEQLKEVEGCVNYLKARPVEWLLDNANLSERFHLVHATHLTANETERLAKTGANVVLCPSTEGNLGDGIFPLRQFQTFGGNWSIGTDSNINLNFFEELRLLDYGQRLTARRRDTFAGEGVADGGLYALTKATLAGRRAMNNFDSEFFAVGAPFDCCVVSADAPLLGNVRLENLASSLVYTTDASQIYGVFIGGKLIRTNAQDEKIKREFLECVKRFR